LPESANTILPEATLLERELESIGQKIASGAIPRESPLVSEGAWGEGWDCAVCHGTIAKQEAEVIAHFRAWDSLCFHVRCFVHWWDVVAALTRATDRR